MRKEVDKVYLGDCVEIMKTLPNKSVDLVFAGLYLFFKTLP